MQIMFRALLKMPFMNVSRRYRRAGSLVRRIRIGEFLHFVYDRLQE